MTSPTAPAPRGRLRSVRVIVAATAFALVQVVLTVSLLPVVTPLAVLAPIGYAAVAGVLSLPQLIAGRFLRARGAIVLTAVFAGCLAAPFSPLGVLVVPAFAVPAAVVEATLLVTRYRWDSRPVWAAACAAGGLAAGAVSLAVVDASLMSAGFVAAILVVRAAVAVALSSVAERIERLLREAGVRA